MPSRAGRSRAFGWAQRRRGRLALGAALTGAGLASVTLIAFGDRSPTIPALLYLVVVAGGATTGGLVVALPASVAAFLLFNAFFTEPFASLRVGSLEDAAALGAFLFAGVLVSELIARIARERAVAERVADRAHRLQRLTASLAEAVSHDDVADAVLAEVVRAADARGGRLELDSGERRTYGLVDGGAEPIRIPLEVERRPLGTLELFPAPGAARDAEAEAAIARLAAQALERARLSDETEERADAARALAYVGDAVFLVDDDGVVRSWNPAAATLTGVAEESARGRLAVEVVPGWAAISAEVRLGGAGSATAPVSTLPVVVDGRERWLAVSGVSFEEGRVYAIRDVTGERALEQARRDFVATASHELRTPLAGIYGAAQTLRARRDRLTEDTEAALLDVIQAEALRLTGIVEQILVAGQLEEDRLALGEETIDVAGVVHDVVEAALPRLPAGTTIGLVADGRVPPASGDSSRLRQVLTNLVDNAVKYSPEGGRIEVRVAADRGRCRIDVADEGIGIPPDEQERIFEKFYRLDPTLTRGVGGTGLGLYISRELVERMGGRLTVRSAPGEGATFTVEVPEAPRA